jgi:hypothetical protein
VIPLDSGPIVSQKLEEVSISVGKIPLGNFVRYPYC